MYVKIMTDKNLELWAADRQPYSLYTNVKHVHFERLEGFSNCQAHITFLDGEPLTVGVHGHAYVMNEEGETISRFDGSKYSKEE